MDPVDPPTGPHPSRRARPPRLGALATLVLVTAVALAAGLVLLWGLGSPASSAAEAPTAVPAPTEADIERSGSAVRADGRVVGSRPPRERPPGADSDDDGVLGVADGEVPAPVNVLDSRYPAVTRLDPALLDALRRAAAAARRDGVEVRVNSGWRSAAYQQHLLARAVSTYGSEEEAAQWVASPETSAHVSGDAVDVAPTEAADWLGAHGARFGLCRVYANEPWHVELRPDAVAHGCPAEYADPSDDPRLHP